MNLNCDESSRRLFFMEKLKECKKEQDDDTESFFMADGIVLKTMYVNKILTTFYVSYEEKYTLTIEINIPKIIYNNVEYYHLPVYQESFSSEEDIYKEYYEMNVDAIRQLIEKKLKEHFACNNHMCDILSCENPYNSNCPQCGFFLCLFCLLNMNLTGKDLTCHASCRFAFSH